MTRIPEGTAEDFACLSARLKVRDEAEKRTRMAAGNDRFRAGLPSCRPEELWVMPEAAARGPAFVSAALEAIATDPFDDDDPSGRRDRGEVEVDGSRVFWGIMVYGMGEDAAGTPLSDPEEARVLRVGLTGEG